MIYAATIFLSSFLLFLVQPLIARLILPWFGGSAAVWTTCMLFFQVVLLAGYGYAHALGKLRSNTNKLRRAAPSWPGTRARRNPAPPEAARWAMSVLLSNPEKECRDAGPDARHPQHPIERDQGEKRPGVLAMPDLGEERNP